MQHLPNWNSIEIEINDYAAAAREGLSVFDDPSSAGGAALHGIVNTMLGSLGEELREDVMAAAKVRPLPARRSAAELNNDWRKTGTARPPSTWLRPMHACAEQRVWPRSFALDRHA